MKMKTGKLIKGNYRLVLIVFSAFLIMVLVSYFYVSRIVQQQALLIGEETMNTTQTAVSSALSEAEAIFANITRDINNNLKSGASNDEILEFLTNTNSYFATEHSLMPDFMMVYAFIRGEMLSGSGAVPPEGYVAHERPWYIGAVESEGSIYFAEPYIDADTSGVIISFSQSILDGDGNLLGVAAIDFNLSRITDYVSAQEIANNGYGVLVDYNMNFTAHRDEKLLGVGMEQAGGGYGRLAQMLAEQRLISAERFTDADGTDSIAFFRTIFNGWHIGIIIPRASYFKQVYRLAAVLGSLGFVLMLILSYILVRFHSEKIRSEEESRSKSSFLARMSHEMRTPMNAIIGMIGVIKKTDSIDDVRKHIEKINDSASHLLGVINDVLDMSKIEAGKMELSETDFRFSEIIAQVTAVMNYKFEEKHQSFTVEVDENIPKAIVADKQRISQVITNLLSNANKFASEGGNICLRVRAGESAEGRCRIRIEVEDDGIGISKDHQERLFNSFEQADNSISRKYGGTGLGLAISKRIINLMNGEIWVESELGKGAKFIITFDVGVGLANEGEGVNNGPASAATGEGEMFAGKHILLADDVEINREILVALLSDTGVTIDCATNGREACELFAGNDGSYDLVFMDVYMPEMDGYEATRKIREMKITRAGTIPIIAMTANVFREDVEKCLQAGMNDHVGKPLDMDIVIEKMKRYLL